MNEIIYITSGVIIGSGICTIAFYIGSNQVKNAFLELTETQNTIYTNTLDSNTTTNKDKSKDTQIEEEGYNWDEYDSYINNPEDNQA